MGGTSNLSNTYNVDPVKIKDRSPKNVSYKRMLQQFIAGGGAGNQVFPTVFL